MSRSSRPVRLPGQLTDGLSRVPTIEHMTIQRMDHVGIVVGDLADAVAFFVELGLELQGEAPVEGDWVDRAMTATAPESTAPSRLMASARRQFGSRWRHQYATIAL